LSFRPDGVIQIRGFLAFKAATVRSHGKIIRPRDLNANSSGRVLLAALDRLRQLLPMHCQGPHLRVRALPQQLRLPPQLVRGYQEGPIPG